MIFEEINRFVSYTFAWCSANLSMCVHVCVCVCVCVCVRVGSSKANMNKTTNIAFYGEVLVG